MGIRRLKRMPGGHRRGVPQEGQTESFQAIELKPLSSEHMDPWILFEGGAVTGAVLVALILLAVIGCWRISKTKKCDDKYSEKEDDTLEIVTKDTLHIKDVIEEHESMEWD